MGMREISDNNAGALPPPTFFLFLVAFGMAMFNRLTCGAVTRLFMRACSCLGRSRNAKPSGARGDNASSSDGSNIIRTVTASTNSNTAASESHSATVTIDVGDKVKWIKFDDDIPEGSIGIVSALHDSEGQVTIETRHYGETKAFRLKTNELTLVLKASYEAQQGCLGDRDGECAMPPAKVTRCRLAVLYASGLCAL